MSDYNTAIINALVSALISGVITGVITALIQPVVDNWLSDALKSKKKRTAVRISLISITFAIITTIVFVLIIHFEIGKSIETDDVVSSTTTESAIETEKNSIESSIDFSTSSSELVASTTEETVQSNNLVTTEPSMQTDMPNIIGDQVIASPGEIVQFKVQLVNNPGILIESFSIDFGSVGIYTQKVNEQILSIQGRDGPIASYELEVPANAQRGEIFLIHLEVKGVSDNDGNPIPCNVIDGQIIIQ